MGSSLLSVMQCVIVSRVSPNPGLFKVNRKTGDVEWRANSVKRPIGVTTLSKDYSVVISHEESQCTKFFVIDSFTGQFKMIYLNFDMQIRENQVWLYRYTCSFANKQQCGKQVLLLELFPFIHAYHIVMEEMIFRVIMLRKSLISTFQMITAIYINSSGWDSDRAEESRYQTDAVKCKWYLCEWWYVDCTDVHWA